jgi:peptidoglycan/LPS O-acetylase OafA/YrhL
MQYRAEIDGLRAIAVLAVIISHAKLFGYTGGFVGVDMFFVLSGFLITNHFVTELNSQSTTKRELLIMFWEKRIRRIFPALYFTLFCCVLASWILLLPSDRLAFIQSLLATLTFTNNALAATQNGYFDNITELKPLIHTWSLAIEEQYYLIFPLFILSIFVLHQRFVNNDNFLTNALLCIISSLILSLAVSQYYLLEDANKAYFLTGSRAFELLIGSATALLAMRYNVSKHRILNQILALIGALMVGYALFSFHNNTPFPSFNALIPTIGTALMLFYIQKNTITHKLLSLAPMVFIGKISYSAYLLHQPIFAFMRHFSLKQVNEIEWVLAIIVVLIAAAFSWRYVEQPFRNVQKYSRKQIFSLALIGGILLCAIGYVDYKSKGTLFIDDKTVQIVEDFNHRTRINHGLHSDCEAEFTLSKNCRTGENPQVLLWGDSFAMHLADMLKTALPNIQFQQNTISVCGPVLGFAISDKKHKWSWAEKCIKNNDKVFAWLKQNKSVRYVVLSSIFVQYVTGSSLWKRDGTISAANEVAEQAIMDTLSKIKDLGVTPIIISPTPQDLSHIANCLLKATNRKIPLSKCNIVKSDYLDASEEINKLLHKIDKKYEVIWLDKMLCDNQFCKVAIDDALIYRDSGHLSHEGSALLGRMIDANKLFPLLKQVKQ